MALASHSNFFPKDYPGLWLYEINQVSSIQNPSVFRLTDLDEIMPEFDCKGPLEPGIIPVGTFAEIKISNCLISTQPSNPRVKFFVMQDSMITYRASYDVTRQTIQFLGYFYEDYTGPAAFFVQNSDFTFPGHFTAFFVNPGTLNNLNNFTTDVTDELIEAATSDFTNCTDAFNNFTANYRATKSS